MDRCKVSEHVWTPLSSAEYPHVRKFESTFVIGDTPHCHKSYIYIYTVRQKAILASWITSGPLYRKPLGAWEWLIGCT